MKICIIIMLRHPIAPKMCISQTCQIHQTTFRVWISWIPKRIATRIFRFSRKSYTPRP